MSTQYYAPQQSAPPPPNPTRGARRQKWVPAAGQRHIVGIESIPGRLVPSGFGPSEVVFDLTDGLHCWYVPQVIADTIYATGIGPGGQIEVMVTGKKKTDLLIIPVQSRLDAASVVSATPAAVQPAFPEPERAQSINSATACMASAMCSAVDAAIETQAYATRKGLGLTFSEESIRAIGLSIYISACQGRR